MNIVPHFHFENPSKKLSNEWCWEAHNYYWYNTGHKSLLHGKNIKQIEKFATGDIDMTPYKKMYKSIADKLNKKLTQTNPDLTLTGDFSEELDYSSLPLIPNKLNSAIALIQKIPVEIECKANDALAMQKKKEDLEFLVNKPILEADLQDLADQLQIDKVDLGSTKHSSMEYSDKPFGLDLSDPEQKDIFAKLMYALRVETSFEKVLQIFYDLKKMEQVRMMEARDQYYYGVSTHDAYTSSMTGMPDADYLFPGELYTQESDLPDFGDNQFRYIPKRMSVLDMFQMFRSDIKDEAHLDRIINEKGTGYCNCVGRENIPQRNFDTFKVNLVLCEVKSLDWVGVYEKPKSKRGTKTLTMDEKTATSKIWGQNTYRYWWLQGTKHFFGKERLPFAHRTRGQESFQNFSTNIYRSQKKSAVELCIGENKKAIIADLKLQHTIITSLPAGKVIDLRGIRNAVAMMADAQDNPYTKADMLIMAVERNIMVIDTQGFEGKNDGQFKPYYEMAGGVRSEVAGYWQVIQQCAANISRLTGINDQVTGQSANPEGLVGMQKLLINSSINAVHYVSEAIETQYQALFNIWASLVQKAIESGGKAKKGIVGFIGMDDVNILDGLNELPLHNLTVKISLTQREEEREKYREQLARLINAGVISVADEYLLSSISNPKERMRVLAIKEVMWKKEQEKQQQLNREAMAQLQEQRNQGLVQATAAKSEGKRNEIYTKADADAKLMEMAAKLGDQKDQFNFVTKRALQRERGEGQLEKAEKTIEKKQEVAQQAPYPIV